MPSTAHKTFRYNLVDVDRLIEAYKTLRPLGQGRRSLGHITRSAIVTLCASWEQYIEDVVIESVELLRIQFITPTDLPKSVKKKISRNVKSAKHDLKPLELAGDGWREIYLAYAKGDVASLHSPKSENVSKLFRDHIGLTDPVFECWSLGKEGLDGFVDVRNMIAHQGRKAGRYVKFNEVEYHRNRIEQTVLETDNFLSEQLAQILPNGRPWRRRG